MAWRRHNPGCPCCGCDCLLDSFDSAIGVTDEEETILRATLHPQKPYPTWLKADVEMDSGTIGRLFFVWDDSDPGDGLYVVFTPQS